MPRGREDSNLIVPADGAVFFHPSGDGLGPAGLERNWSNRVYRPGLAVLGREPIVWTAVRRGIARDRGSPKLTATRTSAPSRRPEPDPPGAACRLTAALPPDLRSPGPVGGTGGGSMAGTIDPSCDPTPCPSPPVHPSGRLRPGGRQGKIARALRAFFFAALSAARGRTTRRGERPHDPGKERNDERRAAGPPAGPGPGGAVAGGRARRIRAGAVDLREAEARRPRRRPQSRSARC